MQILLLILVVLFTAQAVAQDNDACDVLQVTHFEMSYSDLQSELSGKRITVLYVTMENTQKKPLEGPTYCLLSVITNNNDTLASARISGVPQRKRPKKYITFCPKPLDETPDPATVRISLQHYCEDVKVVEGE